MRWLVRFYPRKWRERYEDEFLAMMEQYHLSLGDILNVVLAAGRVRLTARLKSRNARMAKPLTIAACLLLVLAGSFSLNGAAVQASPRYPVYFGVSNSFSGPTYSITNLGETIPHLTLIVDSEGAWRLDRYAAFRADKTGPYLNASVAMHRVGRHVFVWSFGRVSIGQSVQLGVTLTSMAVDPSPEAMVQDPLRYSVFAYGNVRSNGTTDTASRLTGRPYGFGAQTYTPVPRFPRSPTCGTELHFTLTVYQVCANGGLDAHSISLNVLNAGKPIPHFVLRVGSRHLWTERSVTATEWNGRTRVRHLPRVISSGGGVYTWDFGAVPTSSVLQIRLGIVTNGGLGDSMVAYANLTALVRLMGKAGLTGAIEHASIDWTRSSTGIP
jgi:hypothetical protein